MISSKGYWIGSDDNIIKEHVYDKKLSAGLVEFFKNHNGTVVDLGCGLGNYTKHLLSNNIKCDGFDGNPETPKLTNDLCKVLDLSEKINFPVKYDWILSLEVGEHIPSKYEKIFIDNLHNNNNKGIILSWGIENQSGYGHVNCKNNDYIKKLFSDLGYINDLENENILRSKSTVKWFKNTIMVFKKIDNCTEKIKLQPSNYQECINKLQSYLDKKQFQEGINYFNMFDFYNIKNEHVRYKISDILYMIYYYHNDIKGCQYALSLFEYSYINEHIINNSNFLFDKLRSHGYKIVGSTVDRQPKDNEILIVYGPFHKDYTFLPYCNKLYRHPIFSENFKHDIFESDECWDKIDQIYILNLEEKYDRYSDTLVEFCHMNIPLNKVTWYKVKNENENPAKSCYRNHLNIIKDAKNKNYGTTLIFEDDFVFSMNYEKHKKDLKIFFERDYDYDITFLAVPCHSTAWNVYPYDDLLNITKQQWTTMGGYIINNKHIDKIIKLLEDNFYTDGKPIDIVVTKLEKLYFFKDKFGYQRIGVSSIDNRHRIHKLLH